jgi:hypothetical protein
MLFAAIGTAFMSSDAYVDNTFFKFQGDIQLSAIQFENVVMRIKGKLELSGNDFKRPDGSALMAPATNFSTAIPNQIRYVVQDFSFGSMIIDRVEGTTESCTKERCEQIVGRDAPKN